MWIPNEEAIYDVPLEEVWPSVRQFFTDSKLPFREDKGSFVLETYAAPGHCSSSRAPRSSRARTRTKPWTSVSSMST